MKGWIPTPLTLRSLLLCKERLESTPHFEETLATAAVLNNSVHGVVAALECSKVVAETSTTTSIRRHPRKTFDPMQSFARIYWCLSGLACVTSALSSARSLSDPNRPPPTPPFVLDYIKPQPNQLWLPMPSWSGYRRDRLHGGGHDPSAGKEGRVVEGDRGRQERPVSQRNTTPQIIKLRQQCCS